MDRPDSVLRDSFVTVPETVTVPPGCATCGLTESMTTDALLGAGASRPCSPASAAGAAAIRHPPATAIAATRRARVTAARMKEPGAAR